MPWPGGGSVPEVPARPEATQAEGSAGGLRPPTQHRGPSPAQTPRDPSLEKGPGLCLPHKMEEYPYKTITTFRLHMVHEYVCIYILIHIYTLVCIHIYVDYICITVSILYIPLSILHVKCI